MTAEKLRPVILLPVFAPCEKLSPALLTAEKLSPTHLLNSKTPSADCLELKPLAHLEKLGPPLRTSEQVRCLDKFATASAVSK